MGVCSMNRLLVKLAITAAAGSLLCSSPIVAQIPPPQKRAEHVEITKAPELEIAHDDLAIIRWTSTNPGGDDEHFARRALRYGSQGFEPDGEISHQAQPDPSGDDFPGAHGRSEAADDLLLQGDLDGQRWCRAMGWRALSTTSPHPPRVR